MRDIFFPVNPPVLRSDKWLYVGQAYEEQRAGLSDPYGSLPVWGIWWLPPQHVLPMDRNTEGTTWLIYTKNDFSIFTAKRGEIWITCMTEICILLFSSPCNVFVARNFLKLYNISGLFTARSVLISIDISIQSTGVLKLYLRKIPFA